MLTLRLSMMDHLEELMIVSSMMLLLQLGFLVILVLVQLILLEKAHPLLLGMQTTARGGNGDAMNFGVSAK